MPLHLRNAAYARQVGAKRAGFLLTRSFIPYRGGSMQVVWRYVVSCGLALAFGAPTVHGQTTASIFGTVTDESGAAVVGANIQAKNTLTNELRRTATNEVGNYTFPDLAVGLYTIRVENRGFKTAIHEGIELSLNRNARVDVQLLVGQLAEQVSVTADAPLVETTTNEMGALVDQKRIVDLPLNGRNTLSLVSLVPGAENLVTGNAQWVFKKIR